MGFWFGIFDKGTPWRKTPAKINDAWYTPTGGKVLSPSRYFAADAPARSGAVTSGFDALDALGLGTMVAGAAGDGTRPARRGKRGPNRT